MKQLIATLFICLPLFLGAQTDTVGLTPGMVINRSVKITPGRYALEGARADVFTHGGLQNVRPVITIKGANLVVDFQQAQLDGALAGVFPDGFFGVAIKVEGENITLRNLRVRGYKVALLADNAPGLTVENADFSYNYRPRLRSLREREDFSDWLSYHQNDRDEWLRYGAAIYLRFCRNATIRHCTATGNQNALLLNRCDSALVYNNTFQFNSGLGIGLYRSRFNRILHNRLDWNVRGVSAGFYRRGQDSAGILVYEQSSHNTFAFNSATHCGDGLFLWAGQTTMDTGEGGCNDNLIFGNDFSFAPTNGVEATFSRNRIAGNLLEGCDYGIWGGYSFETTVFGNLIRNCRTGVAIEHGQQNVVRQNLFDGDSTGIRLWARTQQPSDWGYAQRRDTRSRDVQIDRNVFLQVRTPLRISASKHIVVNGENLFSGFQTLLATDAPNDSLVFLRNDLYGSAAQLDQTWQHPELARSKGLNFSHSGQVPSNPYQPLEVPYAELQEPDSLPGGINTGLPPGHPKGLHEIHMGHWGPYDFRRPLAALDSIGVDRRGQRVFYLRLLGPAGRWKSGGEKGVQAFSVSEGTLPAKVALTAAPGADWVWVDFYYLGNTAVIGEMGDTFPAGTPVVFSFERFEKKLEWDVRFFNFSPSENPLQDPGAWQRLAASLPAATLKAPEVAFAWWGAPAPNVQEDRFATLATASGDFAKGKYRIELTSDDGARLYLDGKRLIDHWDVHEPATDEVRVDLGGRHALTIEHIEAGGFGALDLRIMPIR